MSTRALPLTSTNLYKKKCSGHQSMQSTRPRKQSKRKIDANSEDSITTTASSRRTHPSPNVPDVPVVQPKTIPGKNVCKLQSVRARLARQQRALDPWSRRAALHLRGPPNDQRRQCKRHHCHCCPRRSGRPRTRPQRDGIPHHRLPSERAECVSRRRARTPMVQNRHGHAATAAAHRLLRRPTTHRRDRRLGRQSSERGNARFAAAAGSTNLASHWARSRVCPDSLPFLSF